MDTAASVKDSPDPGTIVPYRRAAAGVAHGRLVLVAYPERGRPASAGQTRRTTCIAPASRRRWRSGDARRTLWEAAGELSRRLTRIFRRDERGHRPVHGGVDRFASNPHWRDHVLFYEYFHGDNGAGVGASHQTGWTGLVAKLLQQSGRSSRW